MNTEVEVEVALISSNEVDKASIGGSAGTDKDGAKDGDREEAEGEEEAEEEEEEEEEEEADVLFSSSCTADRRAMSRCLLR